MSQGELRDQYGTKVGSYEQAGKDYVIRDKHGFKVGTANKEFLSDNYTVRDKHGSFAYRVEKNVMGSNAKIKDFNGNTLGKVEHVEMGDGAGFFMVAAIIVVILAIIMAPENLSRAFSHPSLENPFFCYIALPFLITAGISILLCIGVYQRKNWFRITDKIQKVRTGLYYEAIIGTAVFVVDILLFFIIALCTEEHIFSMQDSPLAFLEIIAFLVIMIISSLPAYLLVTVPAVIFFAVVFVRIRKAQKNAENRALRAASEHFK